jgi:hypothetical protein
LVSSDEIDRKLRAKRESYYSTYHQKNDGDIENKVLESPQRIKKARFQQFKETIPFTPAEEVKLYRYLIKKPYTSFKRISVRSDKSLSWKTAAIDDVNDKLKEKASNLGGNAVIRVGYDKGIFALFRGIRGYGTAVFIKDLENVEKKPASGWGFWFLGVYGIYLGLRYYYFGKILIPIGILYIIYGFFVKWGYKNKTYLLAFLAMIIASGLIWADHILKNGFQLYNYGSYVITGIFIGMLIVFLYEYHNRKNNPEMPWKEG